jgi:selenocysteine-specific elongation factor
VRVLATAGHVDHGKSTLVRALTGRDPDRLAEERRRGMTIELGFAWTEIPPVGTVAFVDVPGHERFVPTMLAGVGPLGAALLVVAADEGWMPQSAEHLDILRLLGVRHGVVALTRADLVDADTIEVAAALVVEELAGSGLADAPVVAVSARTGAGLPELRTALGAVLSGAPPPPDRGRPRLWVDRAFTVRGVGTVVTGTLLGGGLAVGDVLEVQPAGASARVRGLHALDRPVPGAQPGWRVAINLVGVDVAEVPRGSAVVRQGQWLAATAAEVWCTPARDRVVGRRGAWTVHVGGTAVPATVHPVGGVDLRGPGAVRVELARPVVLAAGDRVVLRDAGRGGTAGGGVVLDPDPPGRPRGAARRAAAVAALRDLASAAGEVAGGAGLAGTEEAGAEEAGMADARRLAALVARREQVGTARALALADAAPGAVAAAGLVELGGQLVTSARADLLASLVVQAVVGVHHRRPALDAVDRTAARQLAESAGASADVAAAVLDRLVEQGRLETVPGGVRVPGHEARLTVAQQILRTALLDALGAAGIEGLDRQEVSALAGGDGDLLDALHREGEVHAAGDRVLARSAVDGALDLLERLAAADGHFTPAQARDALGASRRVVIPLLEVTDALGRTVRDGDLRRVTPPDLV